MNDLQKLVYDDFKYLCEIYEIDIESKIASNATSDSGTLSYFQQRNELFDIYKEYMAGEYETAYEKINEQFVDILKNGMTTNKINDSSEIEKMASVYSYIATHVSKYDRYMNNAREQLNKFFLSNPLFTDEDLKTIEEKKYRLTYSFLSEHKNLIFNNKYLKTFQYSKNTNVDIPRLSKFSIVDTVIITDDFESTLLGLKHSTNGEARILLLFIIDNVTLNFSHFVFVIKYENHIWLTTDMEHFHNPQSKKSLAGRNGGSRIKETTWEKVNLPYDFCMQMIMDKRKESKTVVNKDSFTHEFYTFSINELTIGAKNSIYIYILYILEYINKNQNTLQKIGIFETFVKEQLKLTDGKEKEIPINEIDKQMFVDINYDDCLEFYNEFDFGDDVESGYNELIKIDNIQNSSLVASNKIRNNELMTEETFRKTTQWVALEEKRIEKQNYLDKFIDKKAGFFYGYSQSEKAKADTESLKLLFANKKTLYEKIYPIAFYSPDVYSLNMEGKYDSSMYIKKENKWSVHSFCLFKQNNGYITNNSLIIHYNLGDTLQWNHKYKCAHCGNNVENKDGYKAMGLCIHSWKEICALLKIERKELPEYFRNYNSHTQQPYYGNELLNNVNPLFLISDHASSRYPNGIHINICMCLKCKNQMIKRYNKTNNKIIFQYVPSLNISRVVDYDSMTLDKNNSTVFGQPI